MLDTLNILFETLYNFSGNFVMLLGNGLDKKIKQNRLPKAFQIFTGQLSNWHSYNKIPTKIHVQWESH